MESLNVLAWDFSGSTSFNRNYFECGRKFWKLFDNTYAGEKNAYILWSSFAQLVDAQQLEEICTNLRGAGGTQPDTILQMLRRTSAETLNLSPETIVTTIPIRLWLLTDGEIYEGDLMRCMFEAESFNITQMSVMIVNRTPNMSVAVGFMRNCNATVYFNGNFSEPLLQADMSKPYNYEKLNVSNLDDELKSLQDYITLKKMFSQNSAVKEIDSLIETKNRLLNEIRSKEENAATLTLDTIEDLCENIEKSCYYLFLTGSIFKAELKEVSSAFDALVGYILSRGRDMNLNAIRSQLSVQKTEDVDIVCPENDEENANNEKSIVDSYPTCDFLDPITLEDTDNQPVLLLNKVDLIQKYLFEGSSTIFRRVISCPLSSVLSESLSNVLGTVISVDSYRQLIERNTESNHAAMIRNPTTRQICMGIFLSDQFNDYNDNALMHLFFQSKKVNTPIVLWYYMFWKAACQCAWIENDVKILLREYVINRIRTNKQKVHIVFSNINMRTPFTPVPLHVACYYSSIISSELLAESNSFRLEELRNFKYPIEAVKMMLDIVEIAENKEIEESKKTFANERAAIFQCIAEFKTIDKDNDRTHWILSKYFVTSKYGFLTWVPKEETMDVRLLALLDYDYNKRPIMKNFLSNISNVSIEKFVHTFYGGHRDLSSMKISPKTLRPLFKLDGEERCCFECMLQYYYTVEITVDVNNRCIQTIDKPRLNKVQQKIDQKRLISLFKWFFSYVDDLDLENTLPLKPVISVESFVDYVKKHFYVYNEKVSLFPSTIDEMFDIFWTSYASSPLLAGMTVGQFRDVIKGSCKISDRLIMENAFKDPLDAEKFAHAARTTYISNTYINKVK